VRDKWGAIAVNWGVIVLVGAAWAGFYHGLAIWWRLIEETIYGTSQTSAVDTVAAMIIAAVCTHVVVQECRR